MVEFVRGNVGHERGEQENTVTLGTKSNAGSRLAKLFEQFSDTVLVAGNAQNLLAGVTSSRRLRIR